MRFLVDECTGPVVSRWLREQGHDVFSAYEEAAGDTDEALLRRAVLEDRILVTNDKDFGKLVIRQRMEHRGIVLLRMSDERNAAKLQVVGHVLDRYREQLAGNLVVATERSIRLILGSTTSLNPSAH